MTNKILNISELHAAASALAESLKADIILCKTREEHVRVTARANEAAAIVASLNYFMESGEGSA